ncbi:hypothetical protein NUACC21_67130 [Scytonema sp. NUACC21]
MDNFSKVDNNQKNLGKKRLEAIWAIATYAVGGGIVSGAPNPGVELPKQVILTASDILMYTTIWKIYFEEELSHKGLVEILLDMGFVTIAATGTAYVVAKGTTAVLQEMTNWFGPLGWGVSAAISGSITGVVGAMWTLYCDRLYSQKQSQLAL